MVRGLLLVCLIALPHDAAAHAVERAIVQLLPVEQFIWGGAAAVAITIIVLGGLPIRYFQAAHPVPAGAPRNAGKLWPWAMLAVFAGLITIGFQGPRDPLENLTVLIVWTVVWVGFPLVLAMVGNIWPWCDPWAGPVGLAAAHRETCVPGWIGYWPAIASFAAITWFDLVYPSPRDPEHLAWAMLIYFGLHLAAGSWFGPGWFARGEAFSVFFRLIALLAPVQDGRLRLPGAGLRHAPALPPSGWFFVTLAIASITADGLGATFWWLEQIGVNPLDHPGRSAMVGVATLGLAGVWLILTTTYVAVVWIGWNVAGRPGPLSEALGRLALSLIPIALAYHLGHFLIYLLVNGQYTLAALSNPFGPGLNLLGYDNHDVTTSFLNTVSGVRAIWATQLGLIVAGHLIAALIAHGIAVDLYGRRAGIGGLALGVMMVGMTALGLWLLSTPTGG